TRVEAVLGPVGLRLDELHLRRETVGRVRLLRVAVPEASLLEWNGSKLRVGTDSADAHELLDAAAARVLHQHDAHHEVVIEEAPGVLPIGADTTDARRQMD